MDGNLGVVISCEFCFDSWRCTEIILKFSNGFILVTCIGIILKLTMILACNTVGYLNGHVDCQNVYRIVALKKLQMRKSLHLQRVQRIKRLMGQILEKDQVLCLRLPAKFHIKLF